MPTGYTRESLLLHYDAYAAEVKDLLSAQPPGSFSPSLESMDALVMSIKIGK
jgi:hypothetical protein